MVPRRCGRRLTAPPQAARAHPRTRPTRSIQRAPNALPVIRLLAGELPSIVDQAEEALLVAGRDFYQRGGLVVRPVRSQLKAADDRQTLGWQLLPVDRPHMVETFTRVANFERMDRRAKAFVPRDCPDQVAETYLARVGHWRLPVLLGVVNAPFMHRDGSVCERPGYDVDSGLLLRPDGETFPAVPANPTLDDAREALAYLGTLLVEFPFRCRCGSRGCVVGHL